MTFTKNERDCFGKIADQLIPSSERMPSASEAGVASHLLDQVIALRPDLENGLHAAIASVDPSDPGNAVETLRATDPNAFGLVAEVVANAYFMNPDVRGAIGYDGQSGKEIDPRPDYMEDGLLESVIRRGPIFRPTP